MEMVDDGRLMVTVAHGQKTIFSGTWHPKAGGASVMSRNALCRGRARAKDAPSREKQATNDSGPRPSPQSRLPASEFGYPQQAGRKHEKQKTGVAYLNIYV